MEIWKKISELKIPFNDAANYKSKDDKQFFSKIFLRTDAINKITNPSIYYIIGEKGSGKTAYATYLESNSPDKHICKVLTMTETQYKRFIQLKTRGHMDFSDYANIWRSIILLITCQVIVDKHKSLIHKITGKFSKIESAIKKFNNNSLNPEIESAFEIISGEKKDSELGSSIYNLLNAKKSESTHQELSEKSVKIRHHLLDLENIMKEGIKELKLSKSQTIFIDGIDYRPEGVSYVEYIECIKGLAEALWQLNSDFFSSIKDSSGRLKIALLVRPDIFHKLNIYNSNSRLHDNSVYLDWTTTETEFMSSDLYNLSGRYFSEQQNFECNYDSAWKNYFSESDAHQIFKKILKSSFQKPRDVLTFIKINKEKQDKDKTNQLTAFRNQIVNSPAVNREFSDYLLGEIKNYASFYMKQKDFTIYLKFFQYLNGNQSPTMHDFKEAFKKFKAWAIKEEITAKEYLQDPINLLQFFYDVNIIGYREELEDGRGGFYHWAHKERTLNNIYPKVKEVASRLMINQGIAKSLDIGKRTSNLDDKKYIKTGKIKTQNHHQ